MTLILSAANHDFLVQVSDRRLIDPRTRTVVTEDTIKAVAYCDFMAVGYSGTSRVDGVRTDLWVAEQLGRIARPSPGRAVQQLHGAAESAFTSSLNPPRLAFVAVSWLKKQNEDDEPLHPSIAVISNFHDPPLEHRRPPSRHFVWKHSATVEKNTFLVHALGHPVPQRHHTQLVRNIRRGLEHNVGHRAVMRLLVDTIRKVAATSEAVGEDVLGACIPIGAVRKDRPSTSPFFITKGEPRDDHSSFHDIRTGAYGRTLYQPHIVVPGWRVTGRLEGPHQDLEEPDPELP